MNEQEIAHELSQPKAQELLTSATLARLAYNGSDGFPRVIPIGFHWNGTHIVICRATTSPKVRAISTRPNVAVTIDVGDTPEQAKAVLVRGVGTVDVVDCRRSSKTWRRTPRKPRHQPPGLGAEPRSLTSCETRGTVQGESPERHGRIVCRGGSGHNRLASCER